MRLNQYIALRTGVSRRHADRLITEGRVLLNGAPASLGQLVGGQDKVVVGNQEIHPDVKFTTIMLNKPTGYVCSRNGQGSQTIYELLPKEFHNLKPIGRLDKDSTGLLLLTNEGQLANRLTHPRYQKEKVYEVELDRPLGPADKVKIEQGIKIDSYTSLLRLSKIENCELKIDNRWWRVAMSMGRNRQIRRTFAALDYNVVKLHRTKFGDFELGSLKIGEYKKI